MIGAIGSIVYSLSCRLLHALNIDDPIEASPVHGFTGFWGLIAVGIFDNQFGLITGNLGSGKYFLVQFYGAVTIMSWSLVTSTVYFLIMKCFGLLRVPLLDEILGLDIAEHGKSTPKFKRRLNEGFNKSQSLKQAS